VLKAAEAGPPPPPRLALLQPHRRHLKIRHGPAVEFPTLEADVMAMKRLGCLATAEI